VLIRKLITQSILGLAMFGLAPAHADSLIEYQVETGKRNVIQPVIIKNGTLLVKSAGGDKNLDVLYERNSERLVLIDHKKQYFTPITDEKIGQIARQAEDVQPLLRGIGEQLRKLSPKQKAKWEDMLGGISLDRFDAAKREAESTKLQKTGTGRTVGGVSCEEMNVIKHGAATAEFCLADPTALKLPADDAATIRSLIAFTQRLARKAQGLTQFGIELPGGDLSNLAGIPVQMREFGGKHPVAMTLSRVSDETVASDALKVPEGYRAQSLKLW
jgi:hypothetical protein